MYKNPKIQKKKKSSRWPAIIVISIIVIMAPVIWWGMHFFAQETMVDYVTTEVNGDTLSVILTEKTSSPRENFRDVHERRETDLNDRHYGYFLELYDSAENKSLDKIEFDSPVWVIQDKPQLRVFSDGTIWMVSTNIMQQSDKPGFILKFAIENDKIVQHDFKLDEKYYITGLDGNYVILSDGTGFGGNMIDPVFGSTYLDLETEKVVVTEPYSIENEKPVSKEDFGY